MSKKQVVQFFGTHCISDSSSFLHWLTNWTDSKLICSQIYNTRIIQPPVILASPVSHPCNVRHSATRHEPAARCMAPSTVQQHQYNTTLKEQSVKRTPVRLFLNAGLSVCVCSQTSPSPPTDNTWVMVIVWRSRWNIIRTALCWIVWHSVYSPQHTYVSSSYRSNRLGFHVGTLTLCVEAVA